MDYERFLEKRANHSVIRLGPLVTTFAYGNEDFEIGNLDEASIGTDYIVGKIVPTEINTARTILHKPDTTLVTLIKPHNEMEESMLYSTSTDEASSTGQFEYFSELFDLKTAPQDPNIVEQSFYVLQQMNMARLNGAIEASTRISASREQVLRARLYHEFMHKHTDATHEDNVRNIHELYGIDLRGKSVKT